ncbi:MAG: iron chelate uptake ABC transporter family permease subunit, partial [Clostridia bacterium]|nr:iron chelate uptake ABC transporter family permease subunit [Clostridia bacterium]
MTKAPAVKNDRHRQNAVKLTVLAAVTLASIAGYILINAHPENPKLFLYILSLRLPTLLCMVLASFSIGVATLIFQSIVNNRIVTP